MYLMVPHATDGIICPASVRIVTEPKETGSLPVMCNDTAALARRLNRLFLTHQDKQLIVEVLWSLQR